MKRCFLLSLVLSLLLCGCSGYRQLQVNSYKLDGMERLSLMSGRMSSLLRLSMDITNPTSGKYVIKNLKATVYEADGDLFAEAESTKECVIAPHNDGFVPLDLDVTLHRPMSMFLSKVDFSTMTVDLDVWAFSGIFPVHITKTDYPISQLLKRVGSSSK